MNSPKNSLSQIRLRRNLSLDSNADFLTRPHKLLIMNKNQEKSLRIVQFSKNLEKLLIKVESIEVNTIHTSEIISVNGFLTVNTNEPVPLYGLQLITANQSYEFFGTAKDIIDKWVFSTSNLIKVLQEWYSSNSFKNYWKYSSTLPTFNSPERKIEHNIKCLDSENAYLTETINNNCQKIDNILSEYSKASQKISQKELLAVWDLVLSYLTFSELFSVMHTAKFYRVVTHQYIFKRESWLILYSNGLHPRRMSWVLYTKIFHSLNNDCSTGVVYYQSIISFLIKILGRTEEATRILSTLLDAPYHMRGVWAAQNPRIGLALYQLKNLLKLSMPSLYAHLKESKIKLDLIVKNWILTLFTQSSLPQASIELIWDRVLFFGWAGLISACLAVLKSCERQVVGHSVEHTLTIYAHRLTLDKTTLRSIDTYDSLLAELEQSYLMKLN